MKFSILLKHYRLKKNLTLKKLSKLVGVHESYLSYLENGKRNPPSDEIICKIQNSLGIKNNKLLLSVKEIEDDFTDNNNSSTYICNYIIIE